ncbi:hypothetical protein HMPREF9597_01976 [Cutibacterium acnes HL005PA4]|nr:hypothetical protein HMPREF9567_00908 [Cutibacterium acnes HL013PA1]EFS42738.1 hypothetical protein HMPREF9576_02088 [Cutibacterium acnes HL110PA2]EFS45626.1 hypothetical protein HMPREF9580_01732 [Cutibacterium acnes HL087PA2]EFS57041.1 hypothetical protein HMPREF9593_00450 [Cutibacterium acnes HL046PA2]EFS64996.1 hypothetical protein HMPREF9612_02615 [Cutibacterium acnes HL063PA2]EFS67657.1 hypothetical protein HMPREF9616_02595 [Cutibacterium acnes HL007PA1]EFS70766.1 hypothetical protein
MPVGYLLEADEAEDTELRARGTYGPSTSGQQAQRATLPSV